MLQQTQVKTALPYFGRWMKVFPDFKTLAAAPEAKVLKQWEGLGYYSRARNLRLLARHLAQFQKIPRAPAEWEKLPGVGSYTAAAVTSISFGCPAACVDGNAVRVLARLTAESAVFSGFAEAQKKFRSLAEDLLDRANPGRHNQAIMELGATVCLPKKPLCFTCPVKKFCAALLARRQDDYPRIRRRPPADAAVNRLWVERDGKLLLHKIPAPAKRLANLYEMPPADGLAARLTSKNLLARKRRAIGNRRIGESIYKVKATAKLLQATARRQDLRWAGPAEIGQLPLSGPHRRWINELWCQTPNRTAASAPG